MCHDYSKETCRMSDHDAIMALPRAHPRGFFSHMHIWLPVLSITEGSFLKYTHWYAIWRLERERERERERSGNEQREKWEKKERKKRAKKAERKEGIQKKKSKKRSHNSANYYCDCIMFGFEVTEIWADVLSNNCSKLFIVTSDSDQYHMSHVYWA